MGDHGKGTLWCKALKVSLDGLHLPYCKIGTVCDGKQRGWGNVVDWPGTTLLNTESHVH